jgi:hypothetical protein
MSGLCCLLVPLSFTSSFAVFIAVMLIWGVVAAGDSPQFSAMTATYAPRDLVGSALTISNCIGFAITILSIQTITALTPFVSPALLSIPISVGPFAGLFFMRRLIRTGAS